MSILVYEKPTSRESTLSLQGDSSITYEWFALDSSKIATETQIIAAVMTQFTYRYNGFQRLIFKDIRAAAHGGPYWDGTVTYAIPPATTVDSKPGDNNPDDPDLDNSYSWEIGGGTSHLTQSIATVSQAGVVGIVIPPTKQIIGIDKNKITGVDVVTPKFEITRNIAFTGLRRGYTRTLNRMVGTVNDRTYMGYEKGELLLLGVSGHQKADNAITQPLGTWQLAFKFGVQFNQKAITVGAIPAFNKRGWEYVWFGYQEQFDAASGLTIPVPVYASVEQVYRYTDFRQLGFVV